MSFETDIAWLLLLVLVDPPVQFVDHRRYLVELVIHLDLNIRM